MPYIITEVPQLCGGINLVPPRRIGSKKRVCGVFVDTCQKILNWIEIVCKKCACNLNKIGCFLYESWTLSLSLSLTLSFIRWNIRENIDRDESYLEILAITNKKQIYFYAAKIIYIIIHVMNTTLYHSVWAQRRSQFFPSSCRTLPCYRWIQTWCTEKQEWWTHPESPTSPWSAGMT